ncbi:hypothetical protein CYFUS_006966 [Cystobacter fuscus]|uniref:Uncharacterized protein n=1 Tax=Cystobacter fuscus TaxID=43 RepID=A0A250JD37_9BACT|nr:hypothetical protein [Cystobacter fuscus]ATB41500.1 hypothetical protein CYFUS_006966 [Cystobacter fuscus]
MVGNDDTHPMGSRAARPSRVGDGGGIRLLALLSAAMVACTSCGHARPSRDLNARTYVIDEDASNVGIALGTGGSGYDCDDELKKCFTRCWESTKQPYPHVEHNEWYYEHCTRECRKQYMQCVDEKEKEEAERVKKRPPLEFSSFDEARNWIRAHKTEVAFGTVVIVAGTAFILATGGGGTLILAPLVL